MSKNLRKISIRVLLCAILFCLSLSFLGFKHVNADSENIYKLLDGAEIRSNGEMGIRFAATISASMYQELKDKDAEFGMILAPSDFITDDNDFAFGKMKEYGVDEIQENEVFFNKGINTPVLDEDDYDKNGITNEYLLLCSFVKIKETNYDRSFKARAYYKVDDEYRYADNIVERNVYTVASRYIADDPEEGEAKTYMLNIVDSINKDYDRFTVDLGCEENGVAYVGDTLNITAKVSNGVKELDSGVSFIVKKEGSIVDVAIDKAALTDSGVFTVEAKNGNLSVDMGSLTIKRRNVILSMEDVKFTDFDPTGGVKMFTSILNKTKISDPENLNAEPKFSVKDADNSWLRVYPQDKSLIQVNTEKKIIGDATIIATYTDNYGVTYTTESTAFAPSVTYGTVPGKFTATDTVIAKMIRYAWLTIPNVSLTSNRTEDLLRFGIVNTFKESGSQECNYYKFKISEHNNPSNYIIVHVQFRNITNGPYTCVSIQPSSWNIESGYVGYAAGNTSLNRMNRDLKSSSNLGMATRWPFIGLSSIGQSKFNTDSTNYYYDMLGLSLVNSELFMNYGDRYTNSGAWNNSSDSIFSKEKQATQLPSGCNVWDAFDNVNSVDISICPFYVEDAGEATMLIDLIGGERVTKESLNNMYYSYSESNAPILG